MSIENVIYLFFTTPTMQTKCYIGTEQNEHHNYAAAKETLEETDVLMSGSLIV